ncbi:unnamed protein product [Hyaloperonospora brassicae]|uniref:RXLR phytopathogen effector protein WY-domain domain-containing protein n=1 Tax=Hyaloperonospora brassicae TaxID=162125 RepID=A0AAV0U2D3_HYABA|nr:unnamed protein product [Hyaloperonospora brassicae]
MRAHSPFFWVFIFLLWSDALAIDGNQTGVASTITSSSLGLNEGRFVAPRKGQQNGLAADVIHPVDLEKSEERNSIGQSLSNRFRMWNWYRKGESPRQVFHNHQVEGTGHIDFKRAVLLMKYVHYARRRKVPFDDVAVADMWAERISPEILVPLFHKFRSVNGLKDSADNMQKHLHSRFPDETSEPLIATWLITNESPEFVFKMLSVGEKIDNIDKIENACWFLKYVFQYNRKQKKEGDKFSSDEITQLFAQNKPLLEKARSLVDTNKTN